MSPWFVSKAKPGGVAAFTCAPELSCWMRWVISDSFRWGDMVISGREEPSWSRERRARAALSGGSILARGPERLGWLAGASLPGCSAAPRFYIPGGCQI